MVTFRQTRRAALGAAAALVLVAGSGFMPAHAQSNTVTFTTQLRGGNEVPPADSTATGQVEAVLNKDTKELRWKMTYEGLSGPATGAHFHGPAKMGANAGVVVPFAGPVTSPMSGQATLTAAQVADLTAGLWYANVHTAKFPGGEIRGQMTAQP